MDGERGLTHLARGWAKVASEVWRPLGLYRNFWDAGGGVDSRTGRRSVLRLRRGR